MEWKKWVASHARGTPMDLSWLQRVFPIKVATYSATKLGPDEQVEGDAVRMTLSDMKMDQPDPTQLRISWGVGMTVSLPPVGVDPGQVTLQTADIMAVRKMELSLPGTNPETGQPEARKSTAYSISALEGDGLLIIEILDMQEDLDGEDVQIEVVKA